MTTNQHDSLAFPGSQLLSKTFDIFYFHLCIGDQMHRNAATDSLKCAGIPQLPADLVEICILVLVCVGWGDNTRLANGDNNINVGTCPQ